MKKIINGKMYNTETATELDYWTNGLGCTDVNYICDTLYKKKTGEFFLLGDGGAYSKYGHNSGDGWRGDIVIKPLLPEEAKQWVEENSTAELYEQIFGECEE